MRDQVTNYGMCEIDVYKLERVPISELELRVINFFLRFIVDYLTALSCLNYRKCRNLSSI